MSTDLIDLLERFNRKERFYLIGEALNNRCFNLSDDFRERLRCLIGLEEPIPSSAFAAMDYHLDWIAAAIRQFMHGDSDGMYENEESGGRKLVTGTQEDIDFLAAFKGEDGIHHLIFLEAKGYTRWDNKQMHSKAERLSLIFGGTGDKCDGVRPYLCLASPRRPQRLDYTSWPRWWKNEDGCPYWLEMKVPEERLRVARWDADHGKSSNSGGHFKIIRA